MIVDYELAWVRLQALVAEKSQHGREGLLQRMAELVRECRVPAGELSRLLRLYSVEVERVRLIEAETDRAEFDAQQARTFDDGRGSLSDPELAGHHGPIGGHDDGSANGAGVVNGRRRV